MVLDTVVNLLNPYTYVQGMGAQQRQLVAEGFSAEEAENLTWLQNHRNRGKYWGLGVGIFTVYTCEKYITNACRMHVPLFYYNKSLSVLLRLGLVYTSYLAFDYLYTSHRYSSNNKYTNFTIFNNRAYQDSRCSFLQNFEPLNRRFTEEEKQQFLGRQESVSEQKGERNWIYNPNIHGEDEEAWRHHVQQHYVENKSAATNLLVVNQIQEENREKIYNGEAIQYKPFQTNDYVDRTGKKHGLFKFFLFNRWQPIN
ncbi:hypothetical protein PPERSA_09681 [Pseudocohnilembus persalinus]|uniref:Uncharacterized protein n=1 Tax=Pseudocohnilembus persalinus TaxID=266149 RepID=A0A0V0R737_PSEPJ|nr:hypothetical protein PPERSA_09681 [Pseudocohnilembus persalinus]|eukprot:KRX10297.1 hypothetical protein PPERSA_09681 [Pseudocohnilembus persalinus]